jgi:DNA-binding Lrp family transcriptional regulator
MSPSVPLTTLRLAGRVCVHFILDLVEVGRSNRDLTDDLIILTIIQANLEPLSRDMALQRRYATIDAPPPDELRRPVSISAVANALRFSYETARRRVTLMAADGLCEICPRGVVVSTRTVVSSAHCAVLQANYDKVRELYIRLRSIGFLHAAAPAAEPWGGEDLPLRAVARISGDYFLRLMEPLTANFGDLVRGLLLLTIAKANIEGLHDSERGTDHPGPAGYVDDSKRRPVTVAALAARLNIPQETARRHVAQLVESGRVVRESAGVVMPAAEYARIEIVKVMHANQIHLQRMFASLSQLGVVDEWERSVAEIATATRYRDPEPA